MTELGEPSEVSATEREYRLRQKISPARPTVTITMPKGWTRAALSGVEAGLLGWAIPALLAVLGLLAEGGNPFLHDVDMSQASEVGTQFWGLSLGAPAAVGGMVISLLPLLWSGIQVLLVRAFLIGGADNSASASWFVIPFFVLTTVLIAVAAPGIDSPGAIVIGSVIVSGVAALWAVLSQTSVFPRWWTRISWVWSGVRTGGWWFLAVALTGLIALGVSAVASRQQMGEVAAELGAGGFSAVLLVLVQLAYVPVFAAWAIGWLSGAGIMIGDGQVLTSSSVVDVALPSFPIAQAVPTTVVGGHVVLVLVLVGIGCGLVVGLWKRDLPFGDLARRLGVALLFFSFLVGAWVVLSQGSLGSHKMAQLGPVTTTWPLVVLEVGVAASVVALLIHPETFATAKAWVGPGLRAITATRGAAVTRMLKSRNGEPTVPEEPSDAPTYAASVEADSVEEDEDIVPLVDAADESSAAPEERESGAESPPGEAG